MAEGKFISYLRVSTAKQGSSGLGLEAQRRSVTDFLNGGQWTLLQEFCEVESGKKDDRPKLTEALSLCRIHNATLVIAKIDRLSRDAGFLINLQKAGVKFVAADMPQATELVVGIMALVAQEERKAISSRTKAALKVKAEWYANLDEAGKAALIAQGKPIKLGPVRNDQLTGAAGHKGRQKSIQTKKARAASRASDLLPIIQEIQASGKTTLRQIAKELDQRGISAARGGKWSAVQIQRVLQSIDAKG